MARLYADEMFPRQVSELLRTMGHDVLTVQSAVDTLLPKGEEILGSTSPLKLNPLRYLAQRWFSHASCFKSAKPPNALAPQALTFRVPLGSWIAPKICFT